MKKITPEKVMFFSLLIKYLGVKKTDRLLKEAKILINTKDVYMATHNDMIMKSAGYRGRII